MEALLDIKTDDSSGCEDQVDNTDNKPSDVEECRFLGDDMDAQDQSI